MKSLILTVCLSLSFSVLAANEKEGKSTTEKVIIELTAINSPVKESTANFLIKVPTGFEIDKARYKIKNSSHIFDKSDKHNPLNLSKQGNDYIASVDVNKLPPGQYQFFLKVIDKKSKQEHECHQRRKKSLKDYANFVIDESLEVPVPDPKMNNASIGGIDSDSNGIRDDIQRSINGMNESAEVKEALKQVARGLQLSVLNSNSKEQAVAYLDYFQHGIYCLWGKKVSHDAARIIKNKLVDDFLNTLERTRAFTLVNTHAHGTGGKLPDTQDDELGYCQF